MGKLDDAEIDGKFLLFISDLLTVLLLTIGCALSVASGYRLGVDMWTVAAFCVFAGTVSTVLHRLSQPWGALAAVAGIAGVFWLTWEETAPVLVWIGQAMNLLPVLTGLPLSALRPDSEELLPVFLMLCAALTWLLGWVAVRARRWYLAALLTLVLVLPAIQMGVLPAWGAMLAAFAGWGSMLLTALYSRKDAGSLGRAQLLSLSGMCVLILALVIALPMEGYTRPQWATDFRVSLIRGVTERMERFVDLDKLNNGVLADLGLDFSIPSQSGTASASGSAVLNESGSGGQREDLLSAGPRRYAGRRMLSVRAGQPYSGRIYLRGNSLGVYTGNSWEMVSGPYPFFSGEDQKEPDAHPSLYPAETAGGMADTMAIREIRRQEAAYYPYRLAAGSGAVSESGLLTLPEEDEYIDPVAGALAEYVVDYFPGGPEEGFISLSGRLAAEEAAYRRDVVHAYYLDVPDEAWEVLAPLLTGEQWEVLEERDRRSALEDFGATVELTDDMDTLDRFQAIVAAASRTAELLADAAAYDPDTPAMTRDRDFVSHFLAEGRGYCIHFATAGTLLLRMQGIPARYVTGYTVALNGGQGEVLDSDAHAWVEVYIDGYGWHPVEMTPGYAGGESGVDLSGAPEVQEPDESDEPEPDEPEEEPGQEEDDPEETSSETELPGEEMPEDGPGFSFPWKPVMGAVLALGALGGLYALALLPRRLARKNPDVNRSVISAYRRYSRALCWGGTEDEVMEELGRKAKFSQHILTEEERETAWRCLEQAGETAKKGRKKWKRWALSLLKPLL